MTEKEYNLCINNFADNVFRFLVKNTKDRDLAEDILQDTFMKLWEKRKNVDFQKAKSYIFTASYHNMINNIKYSALKNNVHPQGSHSFNEYNDLQEVLSEALDKLSQIQKACVLLRDYEGYAYNEIGEVLSLSQEQVKINIFRARVRLKEYIVSIDNVI